MSKKISELAAATYPLNGTELVEIVQSGVSKKASAAGLTTPPSASGIGIWKWSTGTSGDPGPGKVGSDNTTAASTTALSLREVSGDGVDFSATLSTLKIGDTVILQERNSTSLAHRFVVSGAVVDSGSYRTLPVSYDTGIGGLPTSDADIFISLTRSSSSGGSGVSLPVVQTFTGPKTLGLSDINTYNVSQDTSAQSVTLPAQATVTWTADAEIHIERGATGALTIVAAAGVQINGTTAGTFTMGDQYSVATLKRKGADLWTLFGNAS